MEENTDTAGWLTKQAAAHHLSVSKRTIERLQAEGKIHGYRVHGWMVRYRKSELDAYMASQQIESKDVKHHSHSAQEHSNSGV